MTLRRSLSGDLDAIVLTALEKQPASRYSSVADFSADIGRHLEGARVDARKFRRRVCPSRAARRGAAIAAVLLLVVCGALFGLIYRRAGAAA